MGVMCVDDAMDRSAEFHATEPQTAEVLRNFAVVALRGSRASLSRTATGTLGTLERHGPQRITTLAELEAVSQPAMSGLVQRFEAGGLVARTADPADARASLIAITDAGIALLSQRRSAHAQQISQAVAALSEADRGRLFEAVPALITLTELYESLS